MREILKTPVGGEELLACFLGKRGLVFHAEREAMDLTRCIQPKVVVAVHCDMFAANCVEPTAFAKAVRESGCSPQPVVLEPGIIPRLSGAPL